MDPELLQPGALVAPAPDLAMVQTVDAALLSCEALGPGVVERVGQDGSILVRWEGSGVCSWLGAQDLRLVGEGRHLVTIVRCNGRGRSNTLRRVAGQLEHSWTVELRPNRVIRAVRCDGLAWTFTFNPIERAVHCSSWTYPPEDEDAEAITAAELATL